MTPREYLSRALYLRMNIARLTDHIEEIRTMMSAVGAIRYDKLNVQSSPTDPILDNIARVIDAEAEAQRMIDEYAKAYAEIEAKIQQMQSDRYKAILSKIYLEGKGVWQVADELGYSVDWTRHMHYRALKAFCAVM